MFEILTILFLSVKNDRFRNHRRRPAAREDPGGAAAARDTLSAYNPYGVLSILGGTAANVLGAVQDEMFALLRSLYCSWSHSPGGSPRGEAAASKTGVPTENPAHTPESASTASSRPYRAEPPCVNDGR